MSDDQVVDIDKKKKMLSFFLIFFPSVIIAITPTTINGSIVRGLAIKLLLLFYLVVVINNFVKVYYGEE